MLLFTGLWFVSSCTTTYYYVVRHAERQDNSVGSPLSSIGLKRADILRDSLVGKGIDSIFASTFIRTRQTAEPMANALGKSLRIYSPDTTNYLITALKKIKRKKILVVGHSDKVPEIVKGLSGQTVPAIAPDDFDNLYIIKLKKGLGHSSRMWHITYGPPSP